MLVLETPPESDFVPYSACTVLPAQAALVLAPHPDDEVFGCGAAIASHVRAGVPVQVLVLTDGALYGDASTRAFRRQQPSNRPVLECLSVSCQLLSFFAAPRFLVLWKRQLL